MSTNASIGRLLEDSSVEAIYLHNDGYPSYVLPILREHYSVIQRVTRLIRLGACSSLGPKIGQKHGFESSYQEHPDWCCFYTRDRGDELAIEHYKALQFWERSSGGYLYLWRDGTWLAHCNLGGLLGWYPAVEAEVFYRLDKQAY